MKIKIVLLQDISSSEDGEDSLECKSLESWHIRSDGSLDLVSVNSGRCIQASPIQEFEIVPWTLEQRTPKAIAALREAELMLTEEYNDKRRLIQEAIQTRLAITQEYFS